MTTRNYTSKTDAESAIKVYFTNRAVAAGRKNTPKIKVKDMDFNGQFFYQDYVTTIGTASVVHISSSVFAVRTEY